jgi:TolB-like protein
MAGEIFISYRRADEAWARLLHSLLRAEGVEAWYDAQIGAGQDWRIATAKALEASQIFVLLFTSNAAQSSDIAKELAAAVFEKKLIIPVRLEDISPDGAFLYELASRNWINAFENTEAKLAELAKGLAHLVRTGARDESVLPFDRSGDGGQSPAQSPRKSLRPPALVAATMIVALMAGAAFWLYPRMAALTQPTAARVAVLPFEALSGNNDVRIFAEGVAEQMVATLNDVQVQTVSREDAATLSGISRDAVAVKLGAEFILSGAVQSGERGLHVTVHLDHALTHGTVWTASYDQNGAAALEFQSQIAAVASDIATQALSATRDDPKEMDDAALGIMLKLVAGSHTMTQAAFLGERDLARELIARAPNYAQAYAALAVTSGLLMNSASPDDIAPLRADAKKAASQALALNSKNGDAYLALAILVPNGRWAEREAAFRKGLAAAPNDATLQNYLAGVLASVGRLQEALALNTTSQMLDSQAPPKNASLAIAQVEAGHVAEGISTINRAARIWPSEAGVWITRFNILANFGREDEARAMLDSTQDIPVSLEAQSLAARRAYLDALRRGSPASKNAAAIAIRSAMATGDLSTAQGMQMFAKLGDVDTAYTLAKTLYTPQDSQPTRASTAPLFQSVTDSMRRDRRFMPLAVQAGLVSYWATTGKWPDFCAQAGLPYDCHAAAKGLTRPTQPQ